jgi:hypothetical protein
LKRGSPSPGPGDGADLSPLARGEVKEGAGGEGSDLQQDDAQQILR